MCSAAPLAFSCVDDLIQRQIAGEVAIADGAVDARVFLIHHATGADVQMPDFGIAHLAGRQSNRGFGSLDQRMGIILPELIEIGFVGAGDGVVGIGYAAAEAIKDEQKYGFGGRRHELILS
jgi:hypothetical protein